VQSYIDATSLQEWIKRGRTFSEDEVKQIAKALLNVLSYLHDHNPPVIHRDIKPSNILLKGDRSAHQVGDLYLVDFGSVQTAVRETGTMTIVGTYGYMPPEQFSGRAFPASDLYSLGATLIYLVTGTHPADLLQEDLLLEFEPVVHLSPSFVQWLKFLTHPNRKQRLSSATVALKALEQPFVQSQPVFSSTTSTPLTLQKPVDSQICLRKDAETLEIYLPLEKPAISLEELGYSFLVFCFFTVISLSCLLLSSVLNGTWLLPVGLMLLYIGICALCQPYFDENPRTRIHIDQKSMSVTKTGFRREQLVFHASRNNLYKLTYFKRLYRQDSEAGIVEVPPELRIWAKHFANYDANDPDISYRIGQSAARSTFYGCLTRQELDWLAQELSNWLGLPLTRE
jgi:serine/threonine protein kinase